MILFIVPCLTFGLYLPEKIKHKILIAHTNQTNNGKTISKMHLIELLFWFRIDINNPDASRAGDKFETSSTNVGYSKYMKLKIRNISAGDFGSYRCVAKNSLGETDGLIKLDGEYFVYIVRCAHIHRY